MIYRVPRARYRETIDFSDASYILDVIGKNKGEVVQHYTDTTADPNAVYTYAVTALSQAQVESSPVSFVYIPFLNKKKSFTKSVNDFFLLKERHIAKVDNTYD